MTDPQHVDIGRPNRLQVVKRSAYGLFLDGYERGEILLPNRFSPAESRAGDWLDVFIYADSEDRLIATTETPKAMVGEVAYLRVAQVNATGAFLDWGLPKQILVPFSEQAERMQSGYSYAVYLYVDRHQDRIVASSKLSKFLPEEPGGYSTGQAVELLICGKSDLGFKCLVDNTFLALLHHSDVFQPLSPGRKIGGYVKRTRADGRIDLCLSKPGGDDKKELEDKILHYIEGGGGSVTLGDKTPPEEIYQLFECSKKNFKRALGKLYKARKIEIQGSLLSLPKR